MIVYERENDFVMVEQHHHAILSGEIANHWRDDLFIGIDRKSDVLFGISQHDRGWIGLDGTPLWNDGKRVPYSFFELPSALKLPHYQQGIDVVEHQNRYAALLCSRHYASFYHESMDPNEIAYYRYELERQNRLRLELGIESDDESDFHVEMLKFLDRLSIYVCINEPGVTKEAEFDGYREGFVNSEQYLFSQGKKLVAHWLDESRIGLTAFPFVAEFEASVSTKIVRKQAIQQRGLAEAYRDAPPIKRIVRFVPMQA